jgi:uncharacterized membrane protein YphA (DoxX/SURF4 family)
MALTRRIARPLLASIFIAEGIDALRDPESKAEASQAMAVPLARWMPSLFDDPENFVRINGAVQVGAGVLLAAGRFRRLASLALIGSIIPTTYAGHRFWEHEDGVARSEQRTELLKNLSLLGGLILAAFDTEGEPSLSWRARRRAARVGAAVAASRAAGRSSANTSSNSVAEAASALARHAQDVTAGAGRDLNDGISRASVQIHDAAVKAARNTDLSAAHVADATAHVADALPEAAQHLAEALTAARQRVVDSTP